MAAGTAGCHAVFTVSLHVCAVTLSALCKYGIWSRRGPRLCPFLFLEHLGASVKTMLCQISIQWHAQHPLLSFCHHHLYVELSQARHLTDRQMETVDSAAQHPCGPHFPLTRCSASACKQTQKAVFKTTVGGGYIFKKKFQSRRVGVA